jgi:cardiolipin synthase (CMP-forming)
VSPWTIPNLLTFSRIALSPAFVVLYLAGNTRAALATFAVAAATDVLDGLAARALDQRSRLGTLLDPVADKVLEAAALFALWGRGQLPLWLAVLVVSRDVAQLLGAMVLRGTRHRVPIAPTRIGKYATFGVVATVLAALAAPLVADPAAASPYVGVIGLLTAECVVLSWGQYFLYFLRSFRDAAAML